MYTPSILIVIGPVKDDEDQMNLKNPARSGTKTLN